MKYINDFLLKQCFCVFRLLHSHFRLFLKIRFYPMISHFVAFSLIKTKVVPLLFFWNWHKINNSSMLSTPPFHQLKVQLFLARSHHLRSISPPLQLDFCPIVSQRYFIFIGEGHILNIVKICANYHEFSKKKKGYYPCFH